MVNIYLQLLDIQKPDTPLVLATVTKAAGSTPQKPGSSAIFSAKGLLCGTVGGGYLEEEVHQITQTAIQTGQTGYYHFGLNNSIADNKGAICGGRASVLIDASPCDHLPVFEMMKNSLLQRIPGVLVNHVNISGGKVLLKRYWYTADGQSDVPGFIDIHLAPRMPRLLSLHDPHGYSMVELNNPAEDVNDFLLLETIFPPARLVIAGAGHIGKALSCIARQLDFEVTVIDSRPEYANAANLPDADHIIVDDIGEAMGKLNKTPDTFVVIVTHGHKDDALALKACIGSEIAYCGMIGSKNKIALMRTDFINRGWSSSAMWDKIYAPVGLAIGSKSVHEIAISIAAELILVKNSKKPSYG